MANGFTNNRQIEGDVPTYASPLHSFAAPSLASGGPSTNDGWASAPTNDPQRNQRNPAYDMRPLPDRPADEWYARNRGDKMLRHSVEDQDADGFTVGVTLKRMAPNPRSIPPPEPRPTSRMSPRTYTFLRPFGQHAARLLNGMHFSMADHRRTYPILGMAPIRTARNTFRLEPAPWDTNIVDHAPNANPTLDTGGYQSVDLPPASNRSGRLG